MTESTFPVGDAQASLSKHLANLDIRVAKSPSGAITAYTLNEPAFCFESYDLGDLQVLIGRALNSYARTFYGIEDFNVTVTAQDAEPPPLPIERVKVESTLHVAFDLAA